MLGTSTLPFISENSHKLDHMKGLKGPTPGSCPQLRREAEKHRDAKVWICSVDI